MNIWLVIILGGALTYLIRLSFIVLIGQRQIPAWLSQGLRFVPPAVLSAIIFPELLMPGGTLDISWGNLRLFAGLAAALVAWRTRNVLLTIAVGMGVLYLLQALAAALTGP
ncbi:MAG: AzlD domain-containing protein [Anaerolineales bacterium]|jgi:branched-subunit amino acid transport protein